MPQAITIRQRIVYGYALVLGLAIVGTVVGLTIGNHYQRRALAIREAATAERQLLSDLQVKILYNRPAKQLSPHLSNRPVFLQESQQLLDRIRVIQGMLEAHLAAHPKEPLAATSVSPLQTAKEDDLYALLRGYQISLAAFYERAQTFIQKVNALPATPDSLEMVQQDLLQLVQSPEFVAFIEFPDQLAAFTVAVEAEEQASEIALQRAEALRTQIILGSLVGSIAIATVIAWVTSRAISQPLTTVTQVAHRVTAENNFDLQVPITGQDEVGILATSINQLIHQVKQLLDQLAHKNQDLEAALAQLEQQQVQLVQTEKMSSLGQLVAGVAHEINNPVNFIHGNLLHVRQYLDDLAGLVREMQTRYPETVAELEAELPDLDLPFIQADLVKILDSMQVGTNRIRQIVLSLRNFSRLDEAEFKAVDLHEGIESSLLILQHRLKVKPNRPAITIHRQYADLPKVECYPGQLNQVIMNILTNAIDALEQRYAETPDDKTAVPLEITLRTAILGADWVEIAIADTGTGMTEAVRAKIFNPFFTTKPEGLGTGIGMSISYQIITQIHRGQLDCISTPGVGTEFLIRIPIYQPAATKP
jgi:signal transduction histidine kinase